MSGLLSRSGGAVAVLLALAAPGLAAAPGHSHLLPATTKEYIGFPNVPKMNEPWQQTELAKILKDPSLGALADQFTQRFNAESDMARRLGFGWDDVRAVATGEATWALVLPAAGKSAAVVLVDVSGKADAAKTRLGEVVAKRGVRGQAQTIDGVAATVYELDGRKAYHLFKDETFVAADDPDVLKAILGRWAGDAKDSLESFAPFQGVFKALAEHKEPVHMRWFMEPFGRAEAMQADAPKPANAPKGKEKRDWLKVLRGQGFDAIKGVGGVLSFSTADCDMVARAAVFAPGMGKAASSKALGIFALLPMENGAPQPWLPQQLGGPLTAYTTVSGDANQAFTALGYIVDALRNDPGYFEDVLKEYKTGDLKVDVRKEIIGQLGHRLTILSDYKAPVADKSERTLMAFELASGANAMTVAEAVRRLLEPDTKRVRKHEAGGAVVWEIMPDPEAKAGAAPPLVSVGAVGVWKGNLLVGTTADVLLDFLRQDVQAKKLSDDEEFKRVHQQIDKLGGTSSSLRMFVKMENDLYVPYELLRANKLAESPALTARVFSMLMGLDRRGATPIDGRKLPEFKALAPHLGQLGAFVNTRDDGWVGAAFVLKK